jgi:hypothetical protein
MKCIPSLFLLFAVVILADGVIRKVVVSGSKVSMCGDFVHAGGKWVVGVTSAWRSVLKFHHHCVSRKQKEWCW